MEYFSAVASLVQCFCRQQRLHESVSKQCSYLDKPQAILGRLDEQLNVLCAQETDIRHILNMGKVLQDMQPKAEVKLWLENVEKIKNSVNQMKEDYAEDKRCLISCVPNCSYRLKLGIVVDQKLHEVNKLLEYASKFSESLLVGKLPERGKTLPAARLMGETAERNFKRIWDYLMDENIGRVGIYGMGGVGKTTIMIEINNRLVRESAHFDNIIWVTASRECNSRKLQKDVAKAVGLDFDTGDDEMTRAAKLCGALMRQKRFLLIIDDLWEAFSLENLGIPSPEVHICKLVLTTRSLGVCRGMETVKEVEIQVLSAEEAWDLFKQKVGGDVVSLPSIENVAKSIARECGGLPLAIGTVGRALRKENNVRQWQIALRELRNSTASLEGMENQVFSRLRFSYERLRDDITRSCFLYCALYPEDHHIETEELIRYWIYEGLLGNLGDMESKMQQGYIILDELKNACMLESADQDGTGSIDDEHVKMHDLIRDMAVVLTRSYPLFLIRAGHGIRIPPVQDEWFPDLERVSLMRNDLSCLDCEPRCPKLSTLLLQYNSISKGINPSFFNYLQNLRVLDLSYTGIDRLPDSLSNLWNLRALLLCSCWNLYNVPTLANLRELRVLDLSYSSIEHMPPGMEMLVNLRRLDLSHCKAYEYPITHLPKYKLLENLLLVSQWQSFDFSFVDVVISCINLSLLEVNFSTLDDFNDYVCSGHWNQLESFKFCIGFPQSSAHIGRNSIAVFGAHMNQLGSPAWLPGRVLELELHDCSGITHLPQFISSASLRLHRCKIQYCDQMEWIITPGWGTFPNLEWLKIEGLRNLNTLCNGIPEEGTLANLKVFHLSACDDLKALFSLDLLQNLKGLQEIVIENCARIEEIITLGTEEEEVAEVNRAEVILPGLHKLRLVSLPRLRRICSTVMICDYLSTVEVLKCPELRTLSFFMDIRQQLVNSLKQIKGSRRWWQGVGNNHPNTIQLLDSAFKEEQENFATDDMESLSGGDHIHVGDYQVPGYQYGDNEIHSGGQSGSSSFGPR